MNEAGLFGAAAVILGAIVGSFLNVVIYRLPRGEFRSKGSRSVCPACGAAIRWFDNIPVLGWLLLRGRARCCKASISPRYPVVEALTALLFGLLWFYGPLAPMVVADPPPGAAGAALLEPWKLLGFAFQAWFVAVLVACTFIDIDHRILPDALTKPTMVIGCVGALFVPGLAGRFHLDGISPALDSVLFSGCGVAVGYGATLAVLEGARLLFRKDAMGYGDVKFMGAIGAFVGWEGVLLTFFLGSVLGAVGGTIHRMVTGDAYVFFGPFLAAGALLALLCSDWLLARMDDFQRWQLSDPNAAWVLAASAVVSLVLLFVLIRRGRAA